jgi:hypothetical protein
LGFSSICDARNATSVARMCAERTHYQRLKRTVVHRPDFISYARWSKSRAIAAWRVLKNELQPNCTIRPGAALLITPKVG